MGWSRWIRTRAAGLGVAAALALAGGCGDGFILDPGSADLERLRAGTWVLVEIEGADGAVDPVTDGDASRPRVGFTGESRNQGLRFGGYGGCNQMGGTHRADRAGGLEILELFATEKACFPERIMEVEEAFFQALAAAESYRVSGDRLVIGSDDRVIRLEAAGG